MKIKMAENQECNNELNYFYSYDPTRLKMFKAEKNLIDLNH